MVTWKSNDIRTMMYDAGRIALDYFDAPQTEHKADDSLVTVADREIEHFFRDRLEDREGEGSYLIGEESAHDMTASDIGAALRKTAWVVDPIDGTAPYANHLPTWGISLARVSGGVITHGALFLPRTGELVMTTDDCGVALYCSSRDPRLWGDAEEEILERVNAPYRSTGMLSMPQEIANRGRLRSRNPMQANGSAVYSVVQLILGNYLAYIARIKLWDLAGSMPLLAQLGFVMEFEDGTMLGLDVTEENWNLDPDSPRCWKSRGLLYLAGNADTVTHLRDAYTIDG